MKKSNTIFPIFLLFGMVIAFFIYFSNSYTFKGSQEKINSLKKEIAFKTLRNGVLLLNFYEPVEIYLDYNVNVSQFLNFSQLNVKFCNQTLIKRGHYFLYYDEKEKCIHLSYSRIS